MGDTEIGTSTEGLQVIWHSRPATRIRRIVEEWSREWRERMPPGVKKLVVDDAFDLRIHDPIHKPVVALRDALDEAALILLMATEANSLTSEAIRRGLIRSVVALELNSVPSSFGLNAIQIMRRNKSAALSYTWPRGGPEGLVGLVNLLLVGMLDPLIDFVVDEMEMQSGRRRQVRLGDREDLPWVARQCAKMAYGEAPSRTPF